MSSAPHSPTDTLAAFLVPANGEYEMLAWELVRELAAKIESNPYTDICGADATTYAGVSLLAGILQREHEAQVERRFTNLDPVLPHSAEPTSEAELVIYDIMLTAAGCEDSFRLNQIMRSRSPDLVDALKIKFESPTLTKSLEERLIGMSVRQDILDDLDISRLHMARAHQIMNTLEVSDPSSAAQQRLQDFDFTRWEHVFGLVFLSLLASGTFQETAPGVGLMLDRMRSNSLSTYVHAIALKETLVDDLRADQDFKVKS